MAHSKCYVPARYPTSIFLSLFSSLSQTFAVEIMQNVKALPPALSNLSGNGLFCFTVNTSLCFWGKYNLREKTMLLNALSHPRQNRRRQGHADKNRAAGIFICTAKLPSADKPAVCRLRTSLCEDFQNRKLM